MLTSLTSMPKTGCGKVQTCKLVDLRTDQRENCRPKLADHQCGLVGKLQTPRNRTPNKRCAVMCIRLPMFKRLLLQCRQV